MKGVSTATLLEHGRGSFLRQAIVLATCAATASWLLIGRPTGSSTRLHAPPPDAHKILERCAALHDAPHVPEDFASTRRASDRYVSDTPAVWLKNASIWTGDPGEPVIYGGDILLAQGIIKFIGRSGLLTSTMAAEISSSRDELKIVEANGAWVTPGLVDVHSHMGVLAAPVMIDDTRSFHKITQPWLRTLDGINTHDVTYELSVAGGVTTVLILPGSGGAISGQGFTMKLRPTAERSTFAMLVDPPFTYNGSGIFPVDGPPRWRHLKQATAENPRRFFGYTRMARLRSREATWPAAYVQFRDTIHALRSAYADARKLLKKQNSFCASAEAGLWGQIGALGTQFPDDLELEALVDVLRGRFKVHTHCYEAVDIDALVQLSNEFKFPLAAIHHAAEAYLVPDVLKKAYKAPPAIALFASQGRYKRESYRGSEFAPKILHEHGIRAVMKSDHPMANGRFLLYEAQQAFLYGLPADVALASVTTTAASVLGLDHRLGSIRTGLDADVVIWDSHPLALGATPRQVYIDGIPQLKNPAVHEKPATFQDVPKTPDFGEAARQTVEYDGLPPLAPNSDSGIVAFLNVAILGDTSVAEGLRTVLVDGGQVVCSGPCVVSTNSTRIIDLRGGVLVPGLISFGAPLGLHEIESEPTTSDGIAPDAINGPVSALLGGDGFIARAVDALALGGRNALLAYRSGVTHAITAQAATFDPDFVRGLSTAFSLGATHRLQQGAIVKELVALHILIERGFEQSVSTRISALRRLLLGAGVGDLGDAFKAVSRGELPLVVDAFSADIIASVLDLKAEVEMEIGSKIRLVISHGHEAHLLASQLGKAGVGVILTTARPFPLWWSMSRMMPGPPLTEKTAIQVLLEHNVTVALGVDDAWDARNTRFNVAWAALDAGGAISQGSAFALASSNLEKLFGVEFPVDLVAYDAGDFWSMSAKPVAIISSSKGCVDVF